MKHLTQLQVSLAGEVVGLLVLRNRQYWFQYDNQWLQNGFDLAPQVMPFNNLPQRAELPVFQGLHGVFYDSLPDGWGLLLMDRFFKQQFSWDTHEVTALDRLAYLGKQAMGALEYEPTLIESKISETINLGALINNAEKILAGKSKTVLKELHILGGSPGGARPKVTLGLANDSDDCVAGLKKLPPGFSHWLVKFRGQADKEDAGRIEKAYAELAERAGLEMPESRLISVKLTNDRRSDFFAVKRFDRINDQKRHMLTLGGYLYADFRLPALDYNALLAATAILTKDLREVQRAFRLMVFNVAVHNKDDHAKNFAFIYDQKGSWRLAPGYDLTFSTGMNNEHTTAINGSGNPTRKDFEILAAAHGIQNWETIVDEVINAVSDWESVAKKYKVNIDSLKKIARACKVIENKIKKIIPIP